MSIITKDQVLDQIEQIIKSAETPYYQMEGEHLIVYLDIPRAFAVKCSSDEIKALQELITDIHFNYKSHCLRTFGRIANNIRNPHFVFKVCQETGTVIAGLAEIVTYPTIYQFNWICGDADFNGF